MKNVQAYKINKFDKTKKINYIIDTLSKYKKSIFFGGKNKFFVELRIFLII